MLPKLVPVTSPFIPKTYAGVFVSPNEAVLGSTASEDKLYLKPFKLLGQGHRFLHKLAEKESVATAMVESDEEDDDSWIQTQRAEAERNQDRSEDLLNDVLQPAASKPAASKPTRYSPRTKGKANAPSAKPDDNDVPLADSEFKQQETAETAEALAAKKVHKKKVPKKSAKADRTPAEVKKAAEVAAVAANDMYYITQQQQQWYRSEKPTLMSGLCTDVIKLADGSDDIYGVHAGDHVYPMYVGALSQTVKGPSGSAA